MVCARPGRTEPRSRQSDGNECKDVAEALPEPSPSSQTGWAPDRTRLILLQMKGGRAALAPLPQKTTMREAIRRRKERLHEKRLPRTTQETSLACRQKSESATQFGVAAPPPIFTGSHACRPTEILLYASRERSRCVSDQKKPGLNRVFSKLLSFDVPHCVHSIDRV